MQINTASAAIMQTDNQEIPKKVKGKKKKKGHINNNANKEQYNSNQQQQQQSNHKQQQKDDNDLEVQLKDVVSSDEHDIKNNRLDMN